MGEFVDDMIFVGLVWASERDNVSRAAANERAPIVCFVRGVNAARDFEVGASPTQEVTRDPATVHRRPVNQDSEQGG